MDLNFKIIFSSQNKPRKAKDNYILTSQPVLDDSGGYQ
jgi:hypothetical protein